MVRIIYVGSKRSFAPSTLFTNYNNASSKFINAYSRLTAIKTTLQANVAHPSVRTDSVITALVG